MQIPPVEALVVLLRLPACSAGTVQSVHFVHCEPTSTAKTGPRTTRARDTAVVALRTQPASTAVVRK